MKKFDKASQVIAGKCMDIRKGESVLILINEQFREMGQSLYHSCLKKTPHTFLMQIGKINPKEPIPKPISQLMKNVDAVIAMTDHSISHTEARRAACKNKTRIASMPHITPSTYCRISDINFERVTRLSEKLADILSMAQHAKVTAPNGTDLDISLSQRKGFADIGIINWPGAFSNLPAGEAAAAPVDGGVFGQLVVDCGMFTSPDSTEQLSIQIKEGKAARISGGLAAKRLRQYLGKYGTDSRLIAEFGMGTNDALRISGHTLEDEKILGTIHIAVGNNISFGGNNAVPIHLDAVVYKATVEIDGKLILDHGRLVL